MLPAIIVIGFNRPTSIKRLLSSLEKAKYDSNNIPLCICIDYKDHPLNQEVFRIADSFEWNYGEKKVIHQKENLGLKKHVIKCGDLVEEYGSIIMLEDDLFVSPYFYSYAVEALKYYKEEAKVAGISLYTHAMNISNLLPFHPLEDGSDVFFLQVASSWGQAWTKQHWAGFKQWLQLNPEVSPNIQLSDFIRSWPSTSWLKHFIAYLVSEDKYFVYPRVSYTTNFSDSGENVHKSNPFFQVSIEYGKRKFNLIDVELSNAKYDSYFELDPKIFLKLVNPNLIEFQNLELDLYGLKKLRNINSKYLISKKISQFPIKSFGLNMKPIELNIINEISGEYFSLAKTDTFKVKDKYCDYEKKSFDFFHGVIPWKRKIKNFFSMVTSRI